MQASQGAPADATRRFRLSVPYETRFGQRVCVVGSTKELGMWKDFQSMTWTEGHIWVSEYFESRSPVHEYKYVLLSDHNKQKWERGVNRMVDVSLFESDEVEIRDIWEKFVLRFEVWGCEQPSVVVKARDGASDNRF